MDSERVTVILPGGLGDAVMSIPALTALKRAGKRIHFIGHPGAGELLADANIICTNSRQGRKDREYHGTIEVLGWIGGQYTDAWKKSIHQSLGSPDFILMFSVDPPRGSVGLEVIGQENFQVYNWQPSAGIHQSDSYLTAVRNYGVKADLNRDLSEFVLPYTPRKLVANTVILHPGSGHRWKNWKMSHFVALQERLMEADFNVLVLEGPEETNMAGKFLRPIRNKSLREVSEYLLARPIFVGNDSGVTHLASALGCSTIAIFGPTHPSEYGPIGTNTKIIRNCPKEVTGSPQICFKSDCLDSISVEEVFNEVILLKEK